MAQLGKYDILEEIGRGGFGVVYKARDLSLERDVALKVLHPQLTVDPSFLERFRKEARTLAKINHPNVVTVYEIGEMEGRVFIAMEYLPGGSLVDRLAQRPLSLGEALKVTGEVAKGLGAGHEEGLVHRDVKPGNILFNKRGEGVIADFGLAKALQISSSSVRSSVGAVGTPYYRAPELWNETPPPSPATDVYALGCVFYEMLTGKILFDGDTPSSVMLKHFQPLPDLGQELAQYPSTIEQAIEKALAKDPPARYQGTNSFIDALIHAQQLSEAVVQAKPKPVLDQVTTRAEPPSDQPGTKHIPTQPKAETPRVRAKPTPLQKRDQSWLLIAGATVLVLLMVVGVITLLVRAISSGRPTAAVPEPKTIVETVVETEIESIEVEVTDEVDVSAVLEPEVVPSTESENDDISFNKIIGPENASQVHALNRWGKGVINELAISPDDTRLCLASSIGIYLYTFPELNEILFIDTHSYIYSVAFASDNKTIASGSSDGTVHLWDVKTGAQLQVLEGHIAWVFSVAFSPDGKLLASGSDDGTVRLWDATTGVQLQVLEGHADSVTSVVFSPDGKTLASGSIDNTVRLWDIKTGAEIQVLDGLEYGINKLGFSSDGRTIAASDFASFLKVWNTLTGKELQLPVQTAQTIAFSPIANIIALGWYSVSLWDLDSSKEILNISELTSSGLITDLTFSHDGQIVVAVSLNGTLHTWDTSTGLELMVLYGFDEIESISFTPDRQIIAFLSNFRFKVLNPGTGNIISVPNWYRDQDLVVFSPDGQFIAVYNGYTIRILDSATGDELQTLEGHNDSIRSLAFAPDAKTIVSGSQDLTVRLWDTTNGKQLLKLEGHTDLVVGVAFSPDGKTFASGSYDGTVRLWDTVTGKQILVIDANVFSENSFGFSHNGRTIVTCNWNSLSLWDIETGARLWEGFTKEYIASVSFSPNGNIIASGGRELLLLTADTGEELQVLKGHTSLVNSVAFSPDGKTLASGSNDGTIRIWGIP